MPVLHSFGFLTPSRVANILAGCGRTNADQLLQTKNKRTGACIYRTVAEVTFQPTLVILGPTS